MGILSGIAWDGSFNAMDDVVCISSGGSEGLFSSIIAFFLILKPENITAIILKRWRLQ